MDYTKKSFSVAVSISQEAWDRTFGKKSEPETPADPTPETGSGSGIPGGGSVEPISVPGNEELPDLSARQCAACLERNALVWVDRGLIQCGICLARFPQGVEEARKVSPELACESCSGTGKLRTSLIAFSCAACGGTGAKGA